MKLYNVLIGWDLWIVAESKEAAHNAAQAIVLSDSEPPGELYSYCLDKKYNIPARVQDRVPYITAAVEAPMQEAGIDLDRDGVTAVYEKLTAASTK